jgi:voltage-gated potassium channel
MDLKSKSRIVMTITALVCITLVGTIGYYLIGRGNWKILDCAYMTIITITTIGYGEVIDIAKSPGGRVFTLFLIVSGIGVASYCITSLAAFLVEGDVKNIFWRKRMEKEIKRMKGHIIVCGGGNVGRYVLEELIKTGRDAVLVEGEEDRVVQLQEEYGAFPAIVGDATREKTLNDAGIERAHGLIAALGEDKDDLCIIITARQLNPDLRIVARSSDLTFAKKLKMAGADYTITPSYIGGLRIASQMIRPQVVGFLDRMLRGKEEIFRIEEVAVKNGSKLIGKTLDEVNLQKLGNILVLAALPEPEKPPLYNPPLSFEIREGTVLVVLAEKKALSSFRSKV